MSSVEKTVVRSSNASERRGISTFLVLWCMQLFSLMGSGLTTFVLSVWVYETTGSVSLFGLIAVCATVPTILFSPIAGALVDRFGQRRAMVVANCGAGLSVLAVVLLYTYSHLELWQMYLAVATRAVFFALQAPAYNSSITSL